MGRKCYVKRCKSGRATCAEKVRCFKAPSDPERLAAWDRAIGRQDRRLTERDHVCAKHFTDDMLIRGRYFAEHGGVVILNTPKRVVLKQDAVPTLFCHQEPPPVIKRPRKGQKKANSCQLDAGTAAEDQGLSACSDNITFRTYSVRVKGEGGGFSPQTILSETSRPSTHTHADGTGECDGTRPMTADGSAPIKREQDAGSILPNTSIESKPALTNTSSDVIDRNGSTEVISGVIESVGETACSLAASACVKKEPESDGSWSRSPASVQDIDESLAFQCENSVLCDSSPMAQVVLPPGFNTESASSDSRKLWASEGTPHSSDNLHTVVKMPVKVPSVVKARTSQPMIEPSLSTLMDTKEVPMPSEAWNRHVVTHKLTETTCFVELKRTNPAAPLFASKSLEITRRPEGFEIKCRVLDQDIGTELVYVDDPLSSPPLVEKLELARRLREFDEKPACPGCPAVEKYADLHLECGGIDRSGVWRHKQCLLVLDDPRDVRCRFCCRLSSALRSQKRRVEKRAARGDDLKRIRLPLGSTDKAKIEGLRTKHHCLMRSKERLVRAKEALEAEVRELRSQLSASKRRRSLDE